MRMKLMLLCTCVTEAVLTFWGIGLWSQTAQPPASVAVPKTAEQVYKNVQVLKGVPADQLIPAMQFITASLGVQCDFCHLEKAFEKDDKETKQTARKMMRMMFALNKDNFDGHQAVTCFACHRGARKPVVVPTIMTAAGPPEEKLPSEEASTAALPSVEQIVGKYMRAIGGAEAAARVSTRVQKGTLTVGSKQFPVEVLAKAPWQRVTTVRFPGGDSVTGVNAKEGWLSSPGRAPHDMGPSELDAAKVDAELFFPGYLNKIFKELRVEKKESLNGKQTYVVSGVRDNQPSVELYFEEDSGLLVRVKRYLETPLGLNPTQIDYADYRQEGAVKTPFHWAVSRPSGSFTVQIEQMQQGIPIEDDRFAKPSDGPPSS